MNYEDMTGGQQRIIDLDLPGYGFDEVGFMEETMAAVRPGFVGDWGTNRGSSSRIFYEMALLHQIDCVVHTVELPQDLSVLDRDHSGIGTGLFLKGTKVKRHRGDGVTEALLAYKRHTGHPGAVFFLDGDHLKENVFRELVLIHRCAPDATLLLHDTREGPGQAARDYLDRFPGEYQMTELGSQAGMMRLTP